jgi:acid phosphatase type 7
MANGLNSWSFQKHKQGRFISVIGLSIGLLNLLLVISRPAAQAAPPVLAWKPYLQQVTDSSAIILWTTSSSGTTPTVHYSTDTSYSASVTGTFRALPSGLTLHRVELTGLEPDTVYAYKIYMDAQDLLPNEFLWFQTAPLRGDPAAFTFLAWGDFGKNSDSQKRLRDRMLLDHFRLMVTTGDNAYPSGAYGEFETNVFQIYQELFYKTPVFPSLGNHDYQTGNGAPYLDLFDLPQTSWRTADQERYYSFDYGNVHFIILDSNSPLNVDDRIAEDDMFDWLRADLQQTRQPWRIAAFHHPAYSTGLHGSDSRVQAKLVPILENYGVELVLNGHDHLYQRSLPLRAGQVTAVEAGGSVYLVSGAGSAADYPCGTVPWLAFSYCGQPLGVYTHFTVEGDNLFLKAIDENGVTLDSYTLTNLISPLAGIDLSGPAAGLVQANLNFMAEVQPLTAAAPLTYTWEATHQTPVTFRGGLAETITFRWELTGSQTITLTVTSPSASISSSHTLTLTEPLQRFYLPVIMGEAPVSEIQ